jgi:signal transduction histidine kinase
MTQEVFSLYAWPMTQEALVPPTAAGPPGGLLADAALAAGLGVFMLVGTFFASRYHAGGRPFDAGAAALILLDVGALVFRRRHPVAVLALVFAVTATYFVAHYSNGPVWLALVIAYYSAAVAGHRVAAATAVAGFVLFSWLNAVLGRGRGASLVGLAALAAWLLVVFGVAEAVRLRRQRAAETLRMQEEAARRRASEDRLRIARDLHDVLAHNISLISVQAGVALHVNEELPPQARTALEAIRQASKEALGELRSVLNILRQTGEAPPRAPTGALAGFEDLVGHALAAGLEVTVDNEDPSEPLPPSVETAAYRIVQEALTNVIRHARATRVWIHVRRGPGGLELVIEDDGQGAAAKGRGSQGSGITGMRERAGALGGELVAGPRPQGGFSVVARLPLEP